MEAVNPETPARPFRRRLYFWILMLGFAGSLVGFAFNASQANPLMPVLIVALVYHAVMLTLISLPKVPIRIFEPIFALFAALLLLFLLAMSLYVAYPSRFADGGIFGVAVWLPAVYTLMFLAFEKRIARRYATVMLLLLMALTLPHALRTQGGGLFDGLDGWLQLYLANAITVVALSFFAAYRQRLQEAQITAAVMRHVANTDPLTGLANRRQMMTFIRTELYRAQRYGKPFSIIMVDVDHFKYLNDTHGHDVGDQVLVELTRRVQRHLRASDRFGRWGGEEFIIAAPETDVRRAGRLAELIRGRVEASGFARDLEVTISGGAATCRPSDTPERLIKRADVSLYRAKEQGRNRIVQGEETKGQELISS